MTLSPSVLITSLRRFLPDVFRNPAEGLSKLVSAVIGRELLVDNIHDKQIRFDISCKTGDGELVNVECF
ncbi:MAG: Rpn family recombination-promoting nuclease/putative transposase [Treponema sp.]|nr:Rpn family recombination-promoting nuclease/putative transposase [Treponema sp.]